MGTRSVSIARSVATRLAVLRLRVSSSRQREPIACGKCGYGWMIADSDYGIKVLRCWVCGNRVYPDYPKKRGGLVCTECGESMRKKNDLDLCTKCLKYFGMYAARKGCRRGQLF